MIATAPSSSPSPSTNPTSSHYNTTANSPRRASCRPSNSSNPASHPPSSPRSYSIRSSQSSSSASTKSNSSLPKTIPFRSPKRPHRDAGTQYSPPDWPPAGTRASSVKPASTQPSPPPPRPASHTEQAGQVTAASATRTQPTLAEQDSPPRADTAAGHPETLGSSVGSSLAQNGTSGAVDAEPDTVLRSKRSRQDAPPPTVMPLDFAHADPKELSNIIADMLMELIRVNDEIPLQDGQLTRFHSRAAPGISVKDYMARLTYHASLPTPILLSMITYIDRLCAAFPIFRINSLTVHRFLITAATVASKGLSDSFWTNGTYSKIGGVSIKELALLELELLSRVDWRIIPRAQDLDDYYRNLVDRCEGYVLEGHAVHQAAG